VTAPDDFPEDMEASPFDDHESEAVFGAATGTPDVPESLRGVADLVHAARRPGSADELVGETEMVAEIATAIAQGRDAAQPRRGAYERIPVFQKFRTAKLAAAATVALMVGGTAAAAATGSLPTQSPSHRAELASSHAAAPVLASDDHDSGEHRHDKVFGTVASVNGVSDPGTCGVAGTDGTFTVEPRHDDETVTVNVSAADTAFSLKHHHDDASFADVCVGTRVKAKGTLDDTGLTLAASKVRIKHTRVHPVKHERKGAFGLVDSVNGVSDPGTCGTAGAAGSFTVTSYQGDGFTVNVDPSTAFAAKDVTDATFANVCVGLLTFSKGDVTDSTVTATAVFIVPPKTDGPDDGDHDKVFGDVTSVNGVSDDGTCGTEGVDGSFTIVDRDGNTVTVNVTAATQFFGKHHWDDDESASFDDVCVGKKAGAKGEQTDAVLAAEMVFVSGDHHRGKFRRHDGHKHDCDGRHGGWKHDGDRDGNDHDGKDASFASHRGDDDDHDRRDGKRQGDWNNGDNGRHGDRGGKSDHGDDDGGWGHQGRGGDDD
jgi:hypothetical protein